MKLRLNRISNRVTAKMVKDYCEEHGCSIRYAKNVLLEREEVLEYFDTNHLEWVPVPVVYTVLGSEENE